MGMCDAHDAVWCMSKQMSPGEGYLLAARFMQNSSVQEKEVEVGVRMGFSREVYKQQLEFTQGNSPWLICEQCADFLKLSEADKNAARQAAVSWWRDNSTAGHMPQQTKTVNEPRAQTPKSNAADLASTMAIIIGAIVLIVFILI